MRLSAYLRDFNIDVGVDFELFIQYGTRFERYFNENFGF